MMVWGHIARFLKAGKACALVTVVSVAGSAPREAGARMVVLGDGRFHGTIGGGELEFQVILWAQKALKNGAHGIDVRTFSLGPDLGQCCGGRTEIALEVLTTDQLANATMLAEAESKFDLVRTQARMEGTSVGVREIQKLDQKSAMAPFVLEDNLLQECFGEAKRPLYLFGAGHVGKALILALAPHPFEVIWVDSRADVFPSAFPPNVTAVQADEPGSVLANAPEDAFVMVMTQSHPLDEAICAAALARDCFDYVGVIGSKTKRARFKKRLSERGLGDDQVAKLVCPIGNPSIRSKAPSAIAAGVVVEMLVAHELHANGHKEQVSKRSHDEGPVSQAHERVQT
ncbi:MAG: xanthine dehydrogenase accessory protein XdhC [Rhodobacteraceae bacterium]|nr:xanthine dehydrogenase accessory protein XdhC [Paracoccaceae bacterium]